MACGDRGANMCISAQGRSHFQYALRLLATVQHRGMLLSLGPGRAQQYRAHCWGSATNCSPWRFRGALLCPGALRAGFGPFWVLGACAPQSSTRANPAPLTQPPLLGQPLPLGAALPARRGSEEPGILEHHTAAPG